MSRIISIWSSESVDFGARPQAQQADEKLKTLLADGTSSLRLQKLAVPGQQEELFCEISSNIVRAFVPKALRETIFTALHNVAHPDIRSTRHLITRR